MNRKIIITTMLIAAGSFTLSSYAAPAMMASEASKKDTKVQQGSRATNQPASVQNAQANHQHSDTYVSQIDQLRKQVEILQLEKQIAQLRTQITQQQTAAATGIDPTTSSGNSSGSQPSAVQMLGAVLSQPALIKVIGMEGNLQATVAYQKNMITVGVGDYISSNLRVLNITHNSILVENTKTGERNTYMMLNVDMLQQQLQSAGSGSQGQGQQAQEY